MGFLHLQLRKYTYERNYWKTIAWDVIDVNI